MANCITMPRLVVADTASGIGKTSAMVGLTRALRERGLKVAVLNAVLTTSILRTTYELRATLVLTSTAG
jgi:cobyrinic acid a,c-diamide synthase